MIVIANKKSKPETLLKKYGADAVIVDVTSKASDEMIRLSPFYPHGGIPVPFSPNFAAMSVEGIWQGLKVFENCGIDIDMFYNTTMKNIKRTVRCFGRPLGHKKGVQSHELLSYIDARMQSKETNIVRLDLLDVIDLCNACAKASGEIASVGRR